MLSTREEKVIETLNANNHWGLGHDEFENLVAEHQAARDSEDQHKMELIEYRLTDINFHEECRMLEEGKYNEVLLMWNSIDWANQDMEQ